MRLLFKFETEYSGSALHIPGNALRHALSLQVNTSVGIFTNTPHLNLPKTYQDFFLFRTKKCFLHPYFELWYDKRHSKRAYRYFFLPEFVSFDLLDPPENLIEIIEKREVIQLGGNRNCGFGVVTLQNYLEIEVEQLQFPEQASHLTLLSPSLVIPPFVERYFCRHMEIEMWNHNKNNLLKVIAPGQFFRIKPGRSIPAIARKGLLRKTLFGQFGFGEFTVHNWKNHEESVS